jgi:hypothetical protein
MENTQAQEDRAMNRHLASSVAATVLTIAAGASPTLAQTYRTPAGIGSAGPLVDLDRRSYAPPFTDVILYDQDRDSAQEGNANQPNFPVQQYGETSGGPGR